MIMNKDSDIVDSGKFDGWVGRGSIEAVIFCNQPVSKDGPPFPQLEQYQKQNGFNHFSLCFHEIKQLEGQLTTNSPKLFTGGFLCII